MKCFGRFLGWASVFSAAMVLTLPAAYSSQKGVIRGLDVQVYSQPSADAKVIEKLQDGVKVSASNNPKLGFFRVRTPSGNLGWISQDAFVPDSELTPAMGGSGDLFSQSSGKKKRGQKFIDKDIRFFRFMGFGGMSIIKDSSLNKTYGIDLYSQAKQFGLLIAVPIGLRWSILLRGEYILNQLSISYPLLSTNFKVDVSSMPVMAGFQYLFIRKGNNLTVGINGYGGYALNTELVSVAESLPSPNTTKYSTSTSTFLITTSFDYGVAQNLFLGGELGYRLLSTMKLTPVADGNGKGVFDPDSDGNLDPFSFSLSGVVFSIGFGYRF